MPTDKRQRQKQGQHARKRAAMEAARRQQRKRKLITFVVLAAVVLGAMVLISSLGGGKDKNSAPDIAAGTGPVPTQLATKDLTVGTGRAVVKDDNIQVNYVGATWKNGKEFQTAWDPATPFTFILGAGSVIEGWDKGIVGMKVGGVRQITIPAAMAYGDHATGGRPSGPLVFVIKLLGVD